MAAFAQEGETFHLKLKDIQGWEESRHGLSPGADNFKPGQPPWPFHGNSTSRRDGAIPNDTLTSWLHLIAMVTKAVEEKKIKHVGRYLAGLHQLGIDTIKQTDAPVNEFSKGK